MALCETLAYFRRLGVRGVFDFMTANASVTILIKLICHMTMIMLVRPVQKQAKFRIAGELTNSTFDQKTLCWLAPPKSVLSDAKVNTRE